MANESPNPSKLDLNKETICVAFTSKITCEANNVVDLFQDAANYIYDIEGIIQTESGTKLGRIFAFYIEGDRILELKLNLFDALDCIEGAVSAISDVIFHPEYKDLDEEVFGPHILSNNLLLIEEIQIEPEYEDYSLDLMAIKAMIRRYGDHIAAVILNNYISEFDTEEEVAVLKAKLETYKTLGFRDIKNSGYLLKNLSEA